MVTQEIDPLRQVPQQALMLRKAIESLVDAKLHDALARPGGLDRLLAHRSTGVASYDIRKAERRLEQTLADMLFNGGDASESDEDERLQTTQ